MQVVWTDPALERVDEVAVYIAQDDPDAAARWSRRSALARSENSSSVRTACSIGSAMRLKCSRCGTAAS